MSSAFDPFVLFVSFVVKYSCGFARGINLILPVVFKLGS